MLTSYKGGSCFVTLQGNEQWYSCIQLLNPLNENGVTLDTGFTSVTGDTSGRAYWATVRVIFFWLCLCMRRVPALS